MFKIFRKEMEWGGVKLVLETGKIARQADGAVMVSHGDTIVLCTAVAARSAKPGQDFFPLTVNYQEKAFAAGKIPGGFFKREGRPSENETLVSRLIDRPIRPLFPKAFKCETQIICTVLAHDMENNPDIAAMIGASAALTLSGVPFFGPIAGARIGWIDGEFVLNPTLEQMEESALDLVMAGTHDGVLMVESEAKELSEDIMLGAVNFGHDAVKHVIDAIIDLAETCAKEPRELPQEPAEVGDINKVLKKRRAGISAVELNGHKLDNIHDITHVMNSLKENEYKIHGKQLSYKDINCEIEINDWPVSTRKHTQKGGHYVFFKSGDNKSSFLTNKNFQTQLGRQIVFELELETNKKMKKFYEEEMKKNSYSNIWKWQEFPFKQNMLNTMSDLIPELTKIKENDSRFDFDTFEEKND